MVMSLNTRFVCLRLDVERWSWPISRPDTGRIVTFAAALIGPVGVILWYTGVFFSRRNVL